jgi:hypothetical protein
VKIKDFRTAVVDNICGGRTTNRFIGLLGNIAYNGLPLS